ncbi:Transcriptional regulatory protein RcsB [compost metagenome]
MVPAIHAAHRGDRYVSPRVESLLEAWPVTEGNGAETRLSGLSQRELEVVRLFVSGMTVSEIAGILRRTKQTISTQKLNAMRKLGIERDGDLYRYANEVGLVASASGAA